MDTSYSILLTRTIALWSTKNLLTDIRPTKPGDVPSRLAVLNTASSVPPSTNALVVLLVLVIKILALRLTSIHTVEAHAVEVTISIGLCLKDDILPFYTAATLTLGDIVVLEVFQTANDLTDAAIVEDIIDRPGIDFGKSVPLTPS